jgi:hypothetical protein
VVLGVELGRFRRMMSCVMGVTLRRVCVVSCRFVVPGFVVLCCLTMMPGGMIVVLRCAVMMFCCFLGHRFSPSEDF